MSVPVLTSDLLSAAPGVRHGFFTREGGVSEGIYAGLNVGVGSGDDPARVTENRRLAAEALGGGPEALITCYQIHSATAVIAESPFPTRPQADAVATRQLGLICGALAADCAPVLMADPQARVVAAAHAGWRGALNGVVEAALSAMLELGAAPERVVAAVGPCIGPDSYEVGLEFLQTFVDADAGNVRFFKPGVSDAKRLFDLPGYVLSRLAVAGVGRAEWIGRDTLADETLFYSNRRAVHRGQKDYGRLLSAITLTS